MESIKSNCESCGELFVSLGGRNLTCNRCQERSVLRIFTEASKVIGKYLETRKAGKSVTVQELVHFKCCNVYDKVGSHKCAR